MRPPHTPTRRRRGPARVTAAPRAAPICRPGGCTSRRRAEQRVEAFPTGKLSVRTPQTPQIRGCLGYPKGIARQDYPAMNGVGTQAWALAAPRSAAKRATGAPPAASAPRAQLGLHRRLIGLDRVLTGVGQRRCRRPVPARTARGGLRQPASPGRAEGDVDASATRCRRRSMPQYQDANEAGSRKGPPLTNARGLSRSHASETARRHDPDLSPVAEVQRRSGKWR